MYKRVVKFTVGAALFAVLLVVSLWLVAPVFIKNKAVERAQAMGIIMNVDSVNRLDGGFLFDGVHLTSKELKFEADLERVFVTTNGSAIMHPVPRVVKVHGGKITLHGLVSEVQDNWKSWRKKHHGAGSGEKLIVIVDGLQLTWKSPCGGDDATATGISARNSDPPIATIQEVEANCLRWKAHATEVHLDAKGVMVNSLELTKSVSDSLSDTSVQKLPSRVSTTQVTLPDIAIGELNVVDKTHGLHTKNFLLRGDSDISLESGDSAYAKVSFDEMEADLPKIHKVSLGKTQAELQLSGLASGGSALLSFTMESEGARGKVQGVTSNKVTFGTTELALHGMVYHDSTWNAPHIKLDESTHVKIKDVQINISGEWAPGKITADVDLPDTDCQKLLDAIPAGMNRAIAGLRMKGSAEMQLHVVKDDSLAEPVVKLHLFNHCKVTNPPDGADRATLRSSFVRVVPGPMGEGVEILTGPRSGKWVPLSEMSPFLIDAIQVTEDPGFFGHYGFELAAIENSLKTDISLGRFARGASTVTMQLAKNLWLSREKTLARKIQEAFLTIYLEQTLSKQEILETYFNIVEFGPMIYGITDAANFYFNTVPSDLTLSQALFLCSILPNPKQNWFGSDGQLQPEKLKWLRTLMLELKHRHLITQAQYDEGVAEIPVRGMPKPARALALE